MLSFLLMSGELTPPPLSLFLPQSTTDVIKNLFISFDIFIT